MCPMRESKIASEYFSSSTPLPSLFLGPYIWTEVGEGFTVKFSLRGSARGRPST